jgi:ribosomal protein S18 acetylase RimI-like enzyme
MANTKDTPKAVKIRPAVPSDAHIAAKLLYESYPDFSMYGPGLNKDERARTIYEQLFQAPKHRFSKDHSHIAEVQGQKAGLIVSFPWKKRRTANNRLGMLLLARYRFKGKAVLFKRLFPMIFMEECGKNDYILSNVAVLPRFQGQGIGKLLVKAAEKDARAEGCKRILVMVPIQNSNARKFFEHLGYKVKAVYLESNRRVKMFGPGYHRLMKKL